MTAVDFARIVENLATGVIIVDGDLRLIHMNPAAEMLLALSIRQARGICFQDLVDASEELLNGMRCCLDSGHPYTEREQQLILADRSMITVDCTVSPLPIVSGAAPAQPPASGHSALLIELRQVDQQLRINREEQLLAQNQTSRALVRNLAHEIKNPLGGLRGAAQLLEQELNDIGLADTGLCEYTQIIIGEADRLRSLVDRMMGPNKPPLYCDVNIHEVLERVRSLVLAESANGLYIRQDYDPSIPVIKGDADQLIQALLNIVRNAVQALSGHGTITMRTRIQRQCTIGLRRYKLVVRIEIIDNGPGIPKELLEDIFFPTISGRAEGTGLGLSIAQSLVNQHGGLIECQSRSGETVFTLLLPLEKTDD
jgi:two-component system nitrogen regulation sensor histidine kinase GlnL